MKWSSRYSLIHSDRLILVFVLVLGLAVAAVAWLVGRQPVETAFTETDSLLFAGKTTGGGRSKARKQLTYRQDYVAAKPFAFDPNTADSTELLRLGLKPWQVRNIYKYRAKGGVFRKAEDFARIYGLSKKEYRALRPYITISDDYRPASELVGERKPLQVSERDTLKFPVKIAAGEQVVLNRADTAMLRRVPGIGSAWAKRIAAYGKRLGGYVAVGQLLELDDFPKEALAYFRVDSPTPEKLNLNKLTVAQMRRHPYINFFQARAIDDYRRLRGPLHSLDDLRLHRDFKPEDIERLRPYVCF